MQNADIKFNRLFLVFICLSAAFFTGCATTGTVHLPAFQAKPLDATGYSQKTNNVIAVLDASSSMRDTDTGGSAKFDIAKEILQRFNQTLPQNMELKSGLRSFGHCFLLSFKKTMAVRNVGPHDASEFSKALQMVSRPGGTSPLSLALEALEADLDALKGKTAVLVVSDGQQMGTSEIRAAEAINHAYPGRICFYTVHVGDSVAGSDLLDAIAEITSCGKSVDADDIAAGPAMAQFVKDVFLGPLKDADGDGVADIHDMCPNTPAGVTVNAKGCPLDSDGDGVYDHMDRCPNTPAGAPVDADGCPLDSDADGVPDYLDACPDTPRGTTVNSEGCPPPLVQEGTKTARGTWVFEGIQFDTGKATLTAASSLTLDKIVDHLRQNPDLRLEIQGHTDNVGNETANYRLSEARANAVKNYFTDNGIDAGRLTAAGFGPSEPIASNKTAEGRQANRRVEFKPLTE